MREAVMRVLDRGPAASIVALARAAEISQADCRRAVQSLRWAGLVRFDALAVNGIEETAQDSRRESGTAREAPGAASSGAAERRSKRSLASEEAGGPSTAPASNPPKFRSWVEDYKKPDDMPPISREAFAWRRAQRALNRAAETAPEEDSIAHGGRARIVLAQREARRRAEESARADDTFEQAKTLLRRAGFAVFGAGVSGGPAGKYYVGERLVSRAELIELAEKRRRKCSTRCS